MNKGYKVISTALLIIFTVLSVTIPASAFDKDSIPVVNDTPVELVSPEPGVPCYVYFNEYPDIAEGGKIYGPWAYGRQERDCKHYVYGQDVLQYREVYLRVKCTCGCNNLVTEKTDTLEYRWNCKGLRG